MKVMYFEEVGSRARTAPCGCPAGPHCSRSPRSRPTDLDLDGVVSEVEVDLGQPVLVERRLDADAGTTDLESAPETVLGAAVGCRVEVDSAVQPVLEAAVPAREDEVAVVVEAREGDRLELALGLGAAGQLLLGRFLRLHQLLDLLLEVLDALVGARCLLGRCRPAARPRTSRMAAIVAVVFISLSS